MMQIVNVFVPLPPTGVLINMLIIASVCALVFIGIVAVGIIIWSALEIRRIQAEMRRRRKF